MASIDFEVAPFTFAHRAAPPVAGEEERGRSRVPLRRGRPPLRPKPPRPPGPPRPPRPPRPPQLPWPPRWPGFVPVPALDGGDAEPAADASRGSEYVRWVQSALNRIEGTRLPVDGVMSAATRSVLRQFQRRHGLPADGIAGLDTEKALLEAIGGGRAKVSEAGFYSQTERDFESDFESGFEGEADRGSRAYTAWGQASLNRALGLKLATDGIAGSSTCAAIRSFQQRAGLRPDGIVGALTEAALRRAGATAPPGTAVGGSVPYAAYAPPAPASPGAVPSVTTRFITVRAGVQLTPQVAAVVTALDAHFARANLKVTLTSAYRPPEDQLRLIRDQAIKRGLDKLYPAITRATLGDVESWIGAWDDLLHRQKYVINPPVPTCSRLVPGKCYSASPHNSGLAFDLSGATLDRIAAVLQGYCRQGGPLRQILVERTNNAVHVGIDSAGRSGDCRISER